MIVRELISRFGFKVDKGQFQKADKSFNKLKVVALGAVVAIAAAAAKLGFAMRNIAIETAALGDRIDKVSEKLGIGAQALQEFRFAARQTGVAQNTLDMALQRFARRSAEAAQGSGEAKDALKELGVKLRDSTGALRPVEELLGDVADGMKRTKGDGDRLRLAFKLFDSEGAALVTTLKGGRDALEDLRRTARETGGVLDNELIAASVEYTDTQHEMSLVVQGFKNLLAKHMLPGITGAKRAIIEWVKANREWLKQGIETAINAIGRAFEFVRRVVTPIAWVIGSLVSGIYNLTKNLYDANPAVFKFAVLMAAVAAAILLPISPLILFGILAALIAEDFVLWWEEGNKANTIMGRLDKTLGGVLGVVREMIKAGEPLDLFGTAFDYWADQAERLAIAIRDATAGLIDLTSGGKLGRFLTFVDTTEEKTAEEKQEESALGREVQEMKAKALARLRQARKVVAAGRSIAQPGVATAAAATGGGAGNVSAPVTIGTLNVQAAPGETAAEQTKGALKEAAREGAREEFEVILRQTGRTHSTATP